MAREFPDRIAAGCALGARLVSTYAGRLDTLVLGVSGGGVIVAAEVARALGLHCGVLAISRLTSPNLPDVPLGAVAAQGEGVVNQQVLRAEAPTAADVAAELGRARAAAAAIQREFPLPSLDSHTVLVIDDGAATGVTMRAAIAAVRAGDPAAVIVALPVAPRETCAILERESDGVVCLRRPLLHRAVAWAYDDFGVVDMAALRAAVRGNLGEG